jgi:hypothetical protein
MTSSFNAALAVLLICSLASPAFPQARLPKFKDFPAAEVFSGEPVKPILRTSEERRYRTVISRGVTKSWGVEDGISGVELGVPGPSFAGHYVIVTWGCGSPCLMAAIVDLKTGQIFPPPFHHGPGRYFQVPWAFPMKALEYRLDSRLLIANICESEKVSRVEGRLSYQSLRCGAHYFVMSDDGLKLIHRVFEK